MMEYMKRKPHQLKPIKEKGYPRFCIFFDAESWEEAISEDLKRQTLRFVGAFYKDLERRAEEWRIYKDKVAFAGWVHSKAKSKVPLYLFAHNLYYDLKVTGIIRSLENVYGWRVEDLFDNGHGLFIRLVQPKQNKTIYMVDTLLLFPFSLRDLGTALGLPKLETDVFTENEKELIQYNRRDIEIIRKAIEELISFLRENGFPWGITLANLSFRIFRKNFMKHRIFIHADPEVDKLEQESYYGGRCEAFKLYKRLWAYKLDVNSMYPYVMRQKLPYDLIDYAEGGYTPARLLKRIKDGYLCIAEVLIDTPEPAFPKRTKDKLIFPIGRFWTVLATPELEYALENRYVVQVRRVAVYRGDYILRDFVDYFYNKRLEAKQSGNEVYSLFYKLILNALYGKFAQRARILEDKYEEVHEDFIKMKALIRGEEREILQFYHDVFIYRKDDEPAFNAFIAVASHITSYARIYLYKLMITAGLENVYYCDTDSIFTNQEGFDRLKEYIDDHELGKLKFEEFGRCYIFGAKMYIFGNRRKMKGIPKKAVRVKERYEWWGFERFRGGLREGLNDDAIYLKKKFRRIVTPYQKRLVLENGETQPIIFNEG